MKLEDIEHVDVIKSLNELAQELNPKHRERLYREIKAFINLGVQNGVYMTRGLETDYENYLIYLTKKQKKQNTNFKTQHKNLKTLLNFNSQ